jgi:putative oxidoreductase
MAAFMQPFAPQMYALLRIVSGLLFLWHGASKLLGFPVDQRGAEPFVRWLGGSIELFGGILVMIGLFTRPAAFLCSGMMATAYWMAHGAKASQWAEHGWKALSPTINGGELAALYCFVFLFIAAHGPGIWSADGARGGAGSAS